MRAAICIFSAFMLHFSAAMKPKAIRILLLLALLVGLFLPERAALAHLLAQVTPNPGVRIDAPAGGAVLQGVVTVSGSTAAEGFQSAEVTFAYERDATGTWFPISASREAVSQGLITTWDTTTITDGTYRLRLQVFLSGGQVQEARVDGLRVRNYSPIETSTPAPVSDPAFGAAPARPTETPTATPLPEFQPSTPQAVIEPTNAVHITMDDLTGSVRRGLILILTAFLAGLIYALLRKIMK